MPFCRVHAMIWVETPLVLLRDGGGVPRKKDWKSDSATHVGGLRDIAAARYACLARV